MKYQRSAGAVIYTAAGGDILYLLLHGKFGWDFPHGLIRPRESEETAALREVYEETGLKVELIPNFREEIRYKYSKRGKTYYREIVYFLARSREVKVALSGEHNAYLWAGRDKALELVRDETRAVLLKAWKKIIEVEGRLSYRDAL
ncbi:MAG: NUDIX domain-containing protein [Pyrobaculum sp.]